MNCNKNGYFAKECSSPKRLNRKINELSKKEEQSKSESDDTKESIYHIEELNQMKEKQRSYTVNVNLYGKEKIFIIDTGSPITIMPMEMPERINSKENREITNKYQGVNKNEVKFRDIKKPFKIFQHSILW